MYRTFLFSPYLVLLRAEIAAFHPDFAQQNLTRLCGSDPHLTVDGNYPLRRYLEPGLSSLRRLAAENNHPIRFTGF